MCTQKLRDASLIYRTETETKTKKEELKTKWYRVCSEETVPGLYPLSPDLHHCHRYPVPLLPTKYFVSITSNRRFKKIWTYLSYK